MKKIYLILFCMYLLLLNTACFAQDAGVMGEKTGMATGMRANGKIYVVVAVIVTILLLKAIAEAVSLTIKYSICQVSHHIVFSQR